MRHLPQYPNPGDKISASLIREIIDAIRELQPIEGPGMKISRGPNGTRYSPVESSSTSSPVSNLPWTFVKFADPETGEPSFEWRRKFIQVGYSLYDYGEELYSDKYTDDTGGEDGYYYLELTFDPDNFNTIPEAEMKCFQEAPESDWENHIHYVYVGKVVDGVQTSGPHVVPIIYMYV